MRKMLVCVAGVTLVCAGCCSAPKPAPMSMSAAVRQVAEGLNAFSAMPLEKRSGLMPDEVTVVLNITNTKETSFDVQGNLVEGPGKLMVDFSHQDAETRGNQITLKFQNVLLAEKSSIVGSKSPDEIATLLQGVTNQNFMLKVTAPGR